MLLSLNWGVCQCAELFGYGEHNQCREQQLRQWCVGVEELESTAKKAKHTGTCFKDSASQ